MRSKSKGSMEMTGAIIVIATMMMSFVYFVYQNMPINTKLEAQSIVRESMFKMEQEGYLTSINKANLIKKLQDKGCTNITVTATSTQVGYGMDISLNLAYDTVIKEIGVADGLIPTLVDKTVRVKIPKSTISRAT